MANQYDALSGIVLDEDSALSLADLSRACHVRVEWIVELVDEGILEPRGESTARWQFAGTSLRRARTVRRLQRDLDINLAGAALALQLMDEIESLRTRLHRVGHKE